MTNDYRETTFAMVGLEVDPLIRATSGLWVTRDQCAAGYAVIGFHLMTRVTPGWRHEVGTDARG